VFVRTNIAPFISVVPAHNNETTLWLKLQGLVEKEPTFIGICYAPPQSSSTYVHASAVDPFDSMAVSFATFQGSGGKVLFAGDLNARTGSLSDIHDAADDENNTHWPHYPPLLHPTCKPPQRANKDAIINSFGRKLVQVCQETGMYILNGRTAGDGDGHLTCQGSSTVDYFLASSNCLNQATSLRVLSSIPDSDHSPLCLTWVMDHQTQKENVHDEHAQSTETAKPCQPMIKNPVSLQQIEDYRVTLEALLNPVMMSDEASIPLAEHLQNIIAQSASMTFGVRKKRNSKGFPVNPWFDEECKVMRKKVQSALLVDDPLAREYRKQYKALTKFKKAKYTTKQSELLCKEAQTDSAGFWRKLRGPKNQNVNSITDEQWVEAFSTLLGPEPADFHSGRGALFPTSCEDCPVNSSDDIGGSGTSPHALDLDITEDEVVSALKKMHRGKAAGIDGITTEFLLFASDILLPYLTCLFNKMFSKEYPDSLSTGIIHPILKSGDINDPDNYRGITVCNSISKLYATVLDDRLHTWAESSNIRAQGQSGFRRGRGTLDNLFILKTLIEQRHQNSNPHQKHKCSKLYTCFVDFRKAFDTIPRSTLWQVLKKTGVGPRMLKALQTMYSNDNTCVRTGNGLTNTFACTTGVKQGCPLSPNLFGLFLDELEELMRNVHGADAPSLTGAAIPILLYADDLVIISKTQVGLQKLMDCLETFCQERGLTVNITKTKVVVFGSRTCLKKLITFNEMPVEQVESFKYLGLEFHQNCSFKLATDKLLASARRATFYLHSRCSALRITDPRLKCQLFDALVYPILSYGCEIWSPNPSHGEDLERWHRLFMRQVIGLPSHCHSSMLYGELGRMPLRHRWHKQTLRFWNRLLVAENSGLLWAAFCEGSRMARDVSESGPAKHIPWCSHVQTLILKHAPPGVLSMYNILDINEYNKMFFKSFRTKALCDISSMGLYYRTFKKKHVYSPYLSTVKNRHLRNLLTRFRSGYHWLEICQGRYSKTPRDMRCCPNCIGVIEDEHHALFDCPMYDDLRGKFSDLFHDDCRTLVKLFSFDQDYTKLARFLTLCRERRVQKSV